MKLSISPDKRHFVDQAGQPFFWLGDTAWDLFWRLTREETDEYLRDRAAKGFNVIQAVLLTEGSTAPPAYGLHPLEGNDPSRPSEKFLKHVDWVMNRAAELGLYVGLLPCWGHYVKRAWFDSPGPPLFNADSARRWGAYVGRRYKDHPLVWILGGDRPAEGAEVVWGAMADGIRGAGAMQLMTFHPNARELSSSLRLHDAPWLDFNMCQTEHAFAAPNYQAILRDRARRPVKPTLDGEPRYESNVDYRFWPSADRPDAPRIGADQVRQAAYWAMLAGAAGHTYGASEIFQFFDPAIMPARFGAKPHWRDAMQFAGAHQMTHMRRLFESRNWQSLVPVNELIITGQGLGDEHIQSAVALDGSFAMSYIFVGKTVTVRTQFIGGKTAQVTWFNPRNGESSRGQRVATDIPAEITSPTAGVGEDWVLVLDRQS